MPIPILSRPAAPQNWASEEYARGVRHKKVGAILHYMVGYLPGTTGMFQNPATGYATSLGLGTGDGKNAPVDRIVAHRYVPADGRSYGSYNTDADARGESIELQNNWPNPASKPSAEIHQAAAMLLAQLAIEQDWRINGKIQLVLGDFPDHRFYQKAIPAFGRDFNVTTHRSMALKDCPGPTDVAFIVAEGNRIINAILNGDPMPEYKEYLDPRKNRALKKGQWSFLHLNKKAYTSFVSGRTRGTAVVNLRFKDLKPGAAVHVRVQAAKVGSKAASNEPVGKNGCLGYMDTIEVIGTGGETFGQAVFTFDLNGDTDALRVCVAPVDGDATLIQARNTLTFWRK